MRSLWALVAVLPLLCGFTISGRVDQVQGPPVYFWSPGAPSVGEWGTLSFVTGGPFFSGPSCAATYCSYAYMQSSAFQTYSVDLRFSGEVASNESIWTYTGGSFQHLVGSLGYIDGDVDTFSLSLLGLTLNLQGTGPGNGPNNRLNPYLNPNWYWSGTWSFSDYSGGSVSGVAIATPEPSTGWLMALGVLGLTLHRRRRPPLRDR